MGDKSAARNGDAEYFRRMSAKNLEQCGTLAEQLICLRNDLDKSHFDMLKIKKQSTSSLSCYHNASFESELKKTESSLDLLQPEPHSIQPRAFSSKSQLCNCL